MVFRNLARKFTLNHRFIKTLTSNVEVLSELPIENEVTISNVETKILDNNQQIKNLTKLKKIINHFNRETSLQVLKDIIPASLLLKNNAVNRKCRLFLVNEDVASNIFKILRPHLETYYGHVMEISAGAGVLTEEFLKAKLRNVRIYEPDPVLCNHLLKLIKLYKSDARLFMANLLALGSILKADTEDNTGRIETLFDGILHSSWESEPVVKLIGVLPNEKFILHIMFSITLQSGLCKYGRPELFLILPPEGLKKLTSKPSEERQYKSKSVVFQVLFDFEELAKVPENALIPCLKTPRLKNSQKQSNEVSEHLCLVKLSPKKDLLQTIPPDLLKSFWIFVNLMMYKKSSLVINKMEEWVPGSGVRLISKGYTIFSDCGSLTPEQYLELYLEFTSWPEFHSSSFIPSVEGFHEKVLQNSLAEEVVSDEKFRRLLKKESNTPEEVVDLDDSKTLEHSDKIPSVTKRRI